MELWDMLCGYLWLHQGATYQVWLPKVVYPLVLDAPRTQAVRRWFAGHDAMPIALLPQARVALVADWRERLERMRQLEMEARGSIDWEAFGYLPWYWEFDFCGLSDDSEYQEGEDSACSK